MSEKKQTCYERVAAAMHEIDDTLRDTLVYPTPHEVIGISELEGSLVLTYASTHDEGGRPQQVWITPDLDNESLDAIESAIRRLRDRKIERQYELGDNE